MRDLATQAEELRSLLRAPDLLVLPNVWDAASARAVEAAGFPVVATSSAAVADVLGRADDDSMPPDEAFDAVARIGRAVSAPVTADLEAGYGLDGAEFVERLLGADAVGCNLEDTDHHGDGVLVPAEHHAARIAAIKDAGRAAGVDIVVNARVDAYARRVGSDAEMLAETVRRGRAYLDAGADCVYPILLADEVAIASVVETLDAPVNILLRPGAPSLARLRELGVARASVGSGLYRVAQRAFADALTELR